MATTGQRTAVVERGPRQCMTLHKRSRDDEKHHRIDRAGASDTDLRFVGTPSTCSLSFWSCCLRLPQALSSRACYLASTT